MYSIILGEMYYKCAHSCVFVASKNWSSQLWFSIFYNILVKDVCSIIHFYLIFLVWEGKALELIWYGEFRLNGTTTTMILLTQVILTKKGLYDDYKKKNWIIAQNKDKTNNRNILIEFCYPMIFVILHFMSLVWAVWNRLCVLCSHTLSIRSFIRATFFPTHSFSVLMFIFLFSIFFVISLFHSLRIFRRLLYLSLNLFLLKSIIFTIRLVRRLEIVVKLEIYLTWSHLMVTIISSPSCLYRCNSGLYVRVVIVTLFDSPSNHSDFFLPFICPY